MIDSWDKRKSFKSKCFLHKKSGLFLVRFIYNPVSYDYKSKEGRRGKKDALLKEYKKIGKSLILKSIFLLKQKM